MPSIRWVRERKMSTPKPNATESTGNRNQSSLNRSAKKSIPIDENTLPQR